VKVLLLYTVATDLGKTLIFNMAFSRPGKSCNLVCVLESRGKSRKRLTSFEQFFSIVYYNALAAY